MPELGPYGSVRGARGNSRPYRDSDRPILKTALLTQSGPDVVVACGAPSGQKPKDDLSSRSEWRLYPAKSATRGSISLVGN